MENRSVNFVQSYCPNKSMFIPAFCCVNWIYLLDINIFSYFCCGSFTFVFRSLSIFCQKKQKNTPTTKGTKWRREERSTKKKIELKICNSKISSFNHKILLQKKNTIFFYPIPCSLGFRYRFYMPWKANNKIWNVEIRSLKAHIQRIENLKLKTCWLHIDVALIKRFYLHFSSVFALHRLPMLNE